MRTGARHPTRTGPDVPGKGVFAASVDLWCSSFDDRSELQAGRQRAIGVAPVTAEPGSAEGVRNGRMTVSDQQGCLQNQSEVLHDPARAALDRRYIGEDVLDLPDGRL